MLYAVSYVSTLLTYFTYLLYAQANKKGELGWMRTGAEVRPQAFRQRAQHNGEEARDDEEANDDADMFDDLGRSDDEE